MITKTLTLERSKKMMTFFSRIKMMLITFLFLKPINQVIAKMMIVVFLTMFHKMAIMTAKLIKMKHN